MEFISSKLRPQCPLNQQRNKPFSFYPVLNIFLLMRVAHDHFPSSICLQVTSIFTRRPIPNPFYCPMCYSSRVLLFLWRYSKRKKKKKEILGNQSDAILEEEEETIQLSAVGNASHNGSLPNASMNGQKKNETKN